jgi:hypothetical protein
MDRQGMCTEFWWGILLKNVAFEDQEGDVYGGGMK